MDREKVIKTIDGCINDDSFCNKCDYEGCVFQHGSCEKDLLADAHALLNEQEGTINELQNAYGYLQKQFFEAQDELLKEQEPIKPNKIGAGWFCGGCNKFLTSNDDKWIKFCWSCGKPVLWKDR